MRDGGEGPRQGDSDPESEGTFWSPADLVDTGLRSELVCALCWDSPYSRLRPRMRSTCSLPAGSARWAAADAAAGSFSSQRKDVMEGRQSSELRSMPEVVGGAGAERTGVEGLCSAGEQLVR